MGMYTELCLTVELRKDTPYEVIDILGDMQSGATPAVTPNHPLFSTDRWSWMLRSGGSYYFAGQPCLVFRHDDNTQGWFLTVLTNIKNYTQEWEHFLNFLSPYIRPRGEPLTYLGWIRYEESPDPTLLYFDGSNVLFRPVTFARDEGGA